ncbi:uncharacterized protein A1O9_11737 [Exophiala aquamarina CBS 119918]|uniref:Zn(2)-C6 fungal-type domain-containing protein n=1 Tax=Exophiala aquamarina CBS 119918 TaxID=1182545 RepID=A0A072NWY2_9EURO|nr:uncharacterized protein A1O9_11737 [Exophiala aquamarina CBS 119918]KEF52111.1 hypothetical protein A1O9_11737 [Exophiala aquamarina CBS 119918]
MSGADNQIETHFAPDQQRFVAQVARRARAACTSCRARKIRCMAPNGQPCANCVYENIQCLLLPKKHRAKKVKSTASASESSQSIPDRAYMDPNQPRQQPADTQSITPTNLEQARQESPPSHTDDDINWEEAALKTLPPPLLPDASHFPAASVEITQPTGSFSIPDFLSPPPAQLAKEDLTYLYQKRALSIPEPEFRSALIKSYILYVHPFYPIIDLEALHDLLHGGSHQNPFSLLVFQTIMFTGSSFVEIKMLRRMGFLTRKAARNAFFLKARLLYDMDYEQDCHSQIQALILMSTWWKTPKEQKDGWHWFGIALLLARTIGLHRDINAQNLSAKIRALRRRLWWSFIIRDTLTSIATNHIPLIRDSDFSVASLTLDDFAHDSSPRPIPMPYGNPSFEARKFAEIAIQTVHICRLIKQVLLTAYHETTTGNIDILYLNKSSKYESLRSESQGLRDVERSFEKSLEDVHSPIEIQTIGSEDEQALQLHKALLSILCHYGILLIHRPKHVNERNNNLRDQVASRSRVRSAAIHVNQILMEIYTADLAKRMSPTIVSCLIPVGISHIQDMKSKNPAVHREGRRHLEECKQILMELLDGHTAAEWAVSFLTYVEGKVNDPPRASNGPAGATGELNSNLSPRTEEFEGGVHQEFNRQSSEVGRESFGINNSAFVPVADFGSLRPLDSMFPNTDEIHHPLDLMLLEPNFLIDFQNDLHSGEYLAPSLSVFDNAVYQTSI